MIDADRALRAFEDVLAVEYDDETDMARVVTMSDCYDVDMRETRHVCPDREYNDISVCKHLVASETVRGQLNVPGGWLVVEDLDERTDDPFQLTDRFPDFDEFMTDTDTDTEIVTDGGESFDEYSYGDEITYVGPDEFDESAVAPAGWKLPYTFQSVSMHGTLMCLTKFNGEKRLAPDHPANDPAHWRRVATDGGQMQHDANDNGDKSGNTPTGHDQFTVWDPEKENAFHFDTRPDAEDKREDAKAQFGVDTELYTPGESPEALYHDDDAATDGGDTGPVEDCDICGDEVPIREAKAGDGGKPIHPDCHSDDEDTDDEPNTEVVDHAPDAADATPEPSPAPDAAHEPEALSADEVEQYAADLDERDVGEDPLKWMPGEFVDTIEGTDCINRKGFEVLRWHYGIGLDMDMEVDPAENDMTHCRYKAVATTPDGDELEAWGTSHVDRGDDPWLLVEMAATRARKRALSIATGAGAVAVAELQNEIK